MATQSLDQKGIAPGAFVATGLSHPCFFSHLRSSFFYLTILLDSKRGVSPRSGQQPLFRSFTTSAWNILVNVLKVRQNRPQGSKFAFKVRLRADDQLPNELVFEYT